MTDESRKERAAAWFAELRDRFCAAFEALEDEGDAPADGAPPGRFERRSWRRAAGTDGADGGGGVTSILRGRVFEKVGVNVSTVHGEFSPAFRARIPGAAHDPRFWASGISLVAHMRSPLVPAVHLNTRFLTTTRQWFGGGADLTPTFPFAADTRDFHAGLKAACDARDRSCYATFRKACDEYFHLPHRAEPRGVGGIFFDDLDDGDWERDFAFVRGVGRAVLQVFPRLVRRRMRRPWSDDQRRAQLVKRGRYVEFNLLFDRGTRFGIETGGDPDAILMSLPPAAAWP